MCVYLHVGNLVLFPLVLLHLALVQLHFRPHEGVVVATVHFQFPGHNKIHQLHSERGLAIITTGGAVEKTRGFQKKNPTHLVF